MCFNCKVLPTNNYARLLTFSQTTLTNNESRAPQLGFNNYWTSFRIIEGTDERKLDKRGSTVVKALPCSCFTQNKALGGRP